MVGECEDTRVVETEKKEEYLPPAPACAISQHAAVPHTLHATQVYSSTTHRQICRSLLLMSKLAGLLDVLYPPAPHDLHHSSRSALSLLLKLEGPLRMLQPRAPGGGKAELQRA